MKSYEDYVRMGRQVLASVRVHQVHIAYFATQVCQIKHGGKERGLYTLAMYSKDIGMNRKTLSGWVSIYRSVIEKLDIDLNEFTPSDFSAATRVHSLLKNEKQAINNALGTIKVKDKGWKIQTPKDKVKELFNRFKKERPVELEVHGWTDTIIGIKNKLIKKDLAPVSTESLLLIKKNLDQSSHYITEYLMESRGLSLKELVE